MIPAVISWIYKSDDVAAGIYYRKSKLLRRKETDSMADRFTTREDCIEMLQEAYKRLDRYPKKSDFTVEEVAAIKSFLGPWPRALEAGGILPDRSAEREAEKRQKRIAAKRRQTQYKIERQKNNRKDEAANENAK